MQICKCFFVVVSFRHYWTETNKSASSVVAKKKKKNHNVLTMLHVCASVRCEYTTNREVKLLIPNDDYVLNTKHKYKNTSN